MKIGSKFKSRYETFLEFIDTYCVLGDDIKLKEYTYKICTEYKDYLERLNKPQLSSAQINLMLSMLDIISEKGGYVKGIKLLSSFKDGEYRLPTQKEANEYGEGKMVKVKWS